MHSLRTEIRFMTDNSNPYPTSREQLLIEIEHYTRRIAYWEKRLATIKRREDRRLMCLEGINYNQAKLDELKGYLRFA